MTPTSDAPEEDPPDLTFQDRKDWTMVYLQTEIRDIANNLQQEVYGVAAEQQNETADHFNNSVKLALSAVLENGTPWTSPQLSHRTPSSLKNS